jgi:phenylalanyl-tRNA synthetase beta chain
MKITQSWIREFVPVSGAPARWGAQLTLAGLELESVTPAAPPFEQVIVGEVLEATKHPNAEKLSVCVVSTDGANRLQIVCGAPNVRAGLKVAVAMIGAKLPNDVTITRTKLRGIDSEGMLCSARELGLGTEHDGILELPRDLIPGTDVRAALDLDDQTIEVNATPNRGDCMSVFGIARDYSAATLRKFLTYAAPPVAAGIADSFAVRIEAPEGCPVFAGRVIRGIKAGAKSPLWLQERLRRVGLNSISAVVDVTNYVMMELGQPMHAYDLAKLSKEIVVRWAKPAEEATLLDGKKYSLSADCLIIADAGGPIGLAGVMGGNDKAISDATVDVFLEAAHFAPAAIAGRARRLGLFTDAAQRFERGVDPGLPGEAIERATALLLQIAGGRAGPADITRGAEAAEAVWVELRRTRLERLLGVAIPDAEVAAVLAAISDRVDGTSEGWRVRIPSCRFDLRIEVDLIEEVARLRGIDAIPPRHAQVEQVGGEETEKSVSPARLFAAMVNRGYREAITYSFVNPADQQLLFPGSKALALTNPISSDLSEMRVSLWPGLLRACAENLRRQQSRIRLFEIGRKYLQAESGFQEVETLAAVLAGSRRPEQWSESREAVDFYDAKADVEGLLRMTGDEGNVRFEAANLSCLRPGRTAQIFRGSDAIGWIGELHPRLSRAMDLTVAAYVFELEIDIAFICNNMKFKEISRYPSIRRDIAVVVDENTAFADIQENVSVSASGLLRELRVFDVYRGPGIDSGRKSIALGLILQDSSRTLTDVDADSVVAAVVARLRDELSAKIRDQ